MQHLDGLTRPSPQLPGGGLLRAITQVGASAGLHVALLAGMLALIAHATIPTPPIGEPPSHDLIKPPSHIVFIARDPRPGGGGGGGGNRHNEPIRRAEGIGKDAITLRIAKPQLVQPRDAGEQIPLPGLLLDARPLASGTQDLLGLPEGGVPYGVSLGPGSGGGVGEGAGTGIGSGTGPGLGPGSGGGTGGGIYRPGGSVTPPRVITQVKPKYTDDALVRKIQGTVILDVVVKSDGRPGTILVTRSLDRGGLDESAVAAAREWRFEPGRLGETPVDVLVTLILDFRIQ